MKWFKENKCKYYIEEVTDKYPSIISHEYKRLLDLLDCGQLYGAFLQVKDVYEVLLKFPMLIIVSEINMKKEKLDLEKKLLGELLNKTLALGHWQENAYVIIKNKLCDTPDILKLLKDIVEIIEQNQIIKWRNDKIGHGALGFDYDIKFQEDIKKNLIIISNYLIKNKDIYLKLELVVIDNKGQINLLKGYNKADNIKNANKSELYVRYLDLQYCVYPFIEIINEGIYFFDSFIQRKEKTCLLNYPIGDKINIHDENFIKLYNQYKNDELVKGLVSSLDEDIYLQSESDILEQISRLNDFEEPEYIKKWLTYVLNESCKKGLLLLQAERGMGKSTFARALDQISLNNKDILDIHNLCIRAYYINDTFGSNIDNFEREVNEVFTYNNKKDKLKGTKIFQINSKKDLAEMLNYYRDIQEKYFGKNKLLLVIDGIDENTTHNNNCILDYIPDSNMLDDGVYILITCRTSKELAYDSIILNKLQNINFTVSKSFFRFKDNEYIELLKKYAINQLSNIDKTQLNDEELNNILKYCDYRFLYLKTTCQIIKNSNINTQMLGLDNVNFIDGYLNILKFQYGEKFYGKLLNTFIIICLTYSPIGIREISYLLGEGNPDFEILPILHDLKGFILVERNSKGNLYSISNEEIKNTIITNYAKEINDIIAKCFNDILDIDFEKNYDDQIEEIFFLKNIIYYLNFTDIDEDKYVNPIFIDKICKLISNIKIEKISHDAIYNLIELSSQIIELMKKLEERFNVLNNESKDLQWYINLNLVINSYIFRATAYSYLNQQKLALKDYIYLKNMLKNNTESNEESIKKLASCYSEIGKIYRHINISESIKYYDYSIEEYKRLCTINNKYYEDYLGNVLNKANSYLRISPTKSLELYDFFINAYDPLNNCDNKFKLLSIAYVSKARAYKRLNNYEKALESINLGLNYVNKLNHDNKDEYFLAKLYVNRGSIYLKFSDRGTEKLDYALRDSVLAINMLNSLNEKDEIVEGNILVNAYFNKGLTYFYKKELIEANRVFIYCGKIIKELQRRNEHINCDLVIYTYKYLIQLNIDKEDDILKYYEIIIDAIRLIDINDEMTNDKFLEELYYIFFHLINKKEYKVIIKLSSLTERFIDSYTECKTSRIIEDIAAIYTVISYAFLKENNKQMNDYFAGLASRMHPILHTFLVNEFGKNEFV